MAVSRAKSNFLQYLTQASYQHVTAYFKILNISELAELVDLGPSLPLVEDEPVVGLIDRLLVLVGTELQSTSGLLGGISQILSANWWLVLLQGIAVFIFGGLLTLSPARTLLILVRLMGLYLLIEGFFLLVSAFTTRRADRRWWWVLLRGGLGILAGGVVLAHPLLSALLTPLILVYILAGLALLSGLIGVVWAIRVRHEINNEWLIILSGVISIIFGLLLFSAPLLSALMLPLVIGVFAIIGGLGLMIFSFRLRRMA